MNNKNSYRLLILTLIGIVMYSCQKDDDIFPEVVEQAPTEGLIKIGKNRKPLFDREYAKSIG